MRLPIPGFASLCLVFVLCWFFGHPAIADQSAVTVRHVELRATAGGMTATGGYAHLENTGPTDIRLVGVEAGFAKLSEIHTMQMVDGVMKMRPLEGGLIIPAGGHARLEPGGHHLMFMGLTAPLQPGMTPDITLVFDNGARITLPAEVKKPADIGTGGHNHAPGTAADNSLKIGTGG